MGSIDKYIFRTTLASFAVVLVSLTGVIWITQALRGIDLMTSQGQTILTFLGVTSLAIPVERIGAAIVTMEDAGYARASRPVRRRRQGFQHGTVKAGQGAILWGTLTRLRL